MKAQRMGTRFLMVALAAATIVGLCGTAQANIYPSGLVIADTDVGGPCETLKVDYVLNENADGDGVNPGVLFEVLDDSNAVVRTVALARQAKGKYTFEWDGRDDSGAAVDDGDYRVRITATDYGHNVWTQISEESNMLTHFERPRGVAVNRNPDSMYYGRVYVSNPRTNSTVSGRPMGDGIYVLNADMSDALGQGDTALTGGLSWSGSVSASPWKLKVGPDDNLYISDWSDASGGVLRTDPNVDAASGELVLATRAGTIPIPSGQNHGSITSAPVLTGTLAGGDLTLYAIDEDLTPYTSLWQWSIGAGPLPYAGTPTKLTSALIAVNGVVSDVERGPDGKFYVMQYRSDGNQAGLFVTDVDGVTILWDSLTETRSLSADATAVDLLRNSRSVAISADGSTLGIQTSSGNVRILPLVNGIPDLTQMVEVLAHNTTTFDHGQVVFDAVGNVYTCHPITERLKVLSPPDGVNSSSATTSQVASLGKGTAGAAIITVQPTDQQKCPGENATFSVTASGSPTYAWRLNGEPLDNGGNISGADTANLTITGLTSADDGGVYTVVVCDEAGNVVQVSDPAQLTVGVSFAKPPASRIVCAGSDPQFEVIARGVGSLSYQWKKQVGEDPPVNVGTDSPTLTLTNVQAEDNGALITVDVTDSCGTVTSPAATLTVRSGPIVTAFSGAKPANVGGSATFSLSAVGIGQLHYQWKKQRTDNTVENVGTDSPFVAVTNLRCDDDEAIVFCEVTDECGTTTTPLSGVLTISGVAEICGNGIDDDCNGLTDCDDPICQQIDPTCMVCNEPFADVEGGAEAGEGDGDVDMADFAVLQRCLYYEDPSAPGVIPEQCECLDRDSDGQIDADDVALFVACGSGPDVPADLSCDDYESGKVVINEIAYDIYNSAGNDVAPDTLEFVELYNADTVAVDISGWILRASDVFPGDDNRDLVVPGGPASGTVVLNPGEFYVFTAANVGTAGVEGQNFQIVDPDEDIWENGPDTLELLDGNRNPVDTVIYDRSSAGTVDVPGEGSIWGDYLTVETTLLSASRYFDGLDTNNNGRDFGMRPQTPGATNEADFDTATPYPVVTTFVPPNVDTASTGDAVAGFYGSFLSALVIDPASARDPNNTSDTNPNPNVIPASPQGGKAIIAWDTAGGANMVASEALFQNGAGYDLYVYLDTTPYGEAGAESATYGILGSTDTLYQFPDPNDLLFGDDVRRNGNTGVGWVFEKEDSANLIRITLCDFGAGGDSSGGPGSATPRSWSIIQSIDLTGVASGWHRLKLSYNAGTGAVHAEFDTQTFDFSTQAGLVGTFYIGYRESLAGVPFAKLRPPTFDLVP